MVQRFELRTRASSRRIQLGGRLGPPGGSGAVYEVLGDPSTAVKVYHGKTSQGELADQKRKLEAMLEDPPDLPPLEWQGRSYVQIAWPNALLFCEGKFVGFGMPALEVKRTRALEFLLDDKLAKQKRLQANMGTRVTVARHLAGVVSALHRKGHHVVDMKPGNVSYYPDTLYMAILDCDGFSVRDGRTGERLTAPLCTPEYLAPEFQKTRDPSLDPEAQDRFALATNIFKLLCHGIHPYSGVLKNPSENLEREEWIARGYFPYGRSGHPACQPIPVSTHACLPSEILEYFERAFGRDARQRPSSHEWVTRLEKYANRATQNLIPCAANAEHQHFAGLECSHCAREAKVQAALSAAARRPPTSQQPISHTGNNNAPSALGGALLRTGRNTYVYGPTNVVPFVPAVSPLAGGAPHSQLRSAAPPPPPPPPPIPIPSPILRLHLLAERLGSLLVTALAQKRKGRIRRWSLVATCGLLAVYVAPNINLGGIARQLVASLQGQSEANSVAQPTSAQQQAIRSTAATPAAQVTPSTNTRDAANQTPTPIELAAIDPSKLVDQVVAANEPGITAVLSQAGEVELVDLGEHVKETGRAFWFDVSKLQRDKTLARRLNAQALKLFHEEKNFFKANNIQYEAFQADPLDREVASNLAIYAFRAGDSETAYRMAVYALSLPRDSDATNTPIWSTLAAALAVRGESVSARNALYVTLAITKSIKDRCNSAVTSTKDTYSSLSLREPVEQMFERIHKNGLSTDVECAMPIQW